MTSFKARLIVPASILLCVLMFLVTMTAPASACVPEDESSAVCSNWRIHPTATPTFTPTPVAVATPTPRADSPSTARNITDTWSSIAPGESIWFKTDYSDGFRNIELWVNSPVQDALDLSIFSPDQMDAWWRATPVGRGTHNKGEPQHVLTWVASYAEAGVWYALLQNHTNSPVSYQLTGNISATDRKKCVGYWETLPLSGEHIFWVDCGHYQVIPP